MSSPTSQRLEVVVRQLHRGKGSGGNVLPYHWAILFHKRDNFREAHVYQVAGNIDTFMLDNFHTEENFRKLEEYRGAVKVGTIDGSDVSRAEGVFRDIPVHRHRPDWNSQNWCMSALTRLKAAGLTDATKSETMLRDELAEQDNLWEMGEDVYGE